MDALAERPAFGVGQEPANPPVIALIERGVLGTAPTSKTYVTAGAVGLPLMALVAIGAFRALGQEQAPFWKVVHGATGAIGVIGGAAAVYALVTGLGMPKEK